MKTMYRVYDSFDRKWVTDRVYLSPNDVVIEQRGLMKKLFGLVKLRLASDVRFVVHHFIQAYDKNDRRIFEGDICKAKDGEFIGIVTYVAEHCAYYLLDHRNAKFYPLGDDYRDMVEIVGNIIDNPELLETPVQQTDVYTYDESEDDDTEDDVQ